jgi:hypothetical protein
MVATLGGIGIYKGISKYFSAFGKVKVLGFKDSQ